MCDVYDTPNTIPVAAIRLLKNRATNWATRAPFLDLSDKNRRTVRWQTQEPHRILTFESRGDCTSKQNSPVLLVVEAISISRTQAPPKRTALLPPSSSLVIYLDGNGMAVSSFSKGFPFCAAADQLSGGNPRTHVRRPCGKSFRSWLMESITGTRNEPRWIAFFVDNGWKIAQQFFQRRFNWFEKINMINNPWKWSTE